MKKNIFENPNEYLRELDKIKFFDEKTVEEEKKLYSGLSLACVWPTKLCPLGCETCFFKSTMEHESSELEEYKFSDKGLDKLIKFINDSNNGYLMLSGGGDPMIDPKCIEKIIRDTKSKRIIVITSGFWAKTEENTERIIKRLHKAIEGRKFKDCGKVVLRISVDQFHRKQIGGNQNYFNIINAFKKYFAHDGNFILLFHSLKNDKVVEELAKEMGASLEHKFNLVSDNDQVTKIMIESSEFSLDDYNFTVSYSKLFNSNVMVDMADFECVDKNVEIIREDMKKSEQNNPTYVPNVDGNKGIDYWVNYNGNVTTWMNQDPENIYNVYEDDYETFLNKTFNSPMAMYLIKNGYVARNEIISEVNELAVRRADAVNIRDFYSTLLLTEKNTKLYYYIRAIQEFIKLGKIDPSKLDELSFELKTMILSSPNDVRLIYKLADYDILKQELHEESFDKEIWLNWLTLVQKGQYKVNGDRLVKKIDYLIKNTSDAVFKEDNYVKRYYSISETMSPMSRTLLKRLVAERNQ